ncbi:MAG: gamma-glutamyltransferase, partial [Rhodospirillaceae bacterium]|nr:gamma-glutamyltransferase [Rhodospirillaceae bacterium]
MVGAGLICVACGSDGPPEGQVGFVEDNFGGVVSDEPRSALIGRDILSAGGNAADAAVATYFAMSVSYPGAATLGGGGMCVVYRGDQEIVETIDFRPMLFVAGNRAVMIPGSVRGMFALHARYGRLKWEALLLPAERLARFGNPVSRAFARQVAGLPDVAFADFDFRRIFAPRGKPLVEGEVLRQEELSATLAGIRLRGPGEFYSGDLAHLLASELGSMAGITVPVDVFRGYRPKWLKTVIVDVGKNELHLPAGQGGEWAAEIWQTLADKRLPPAQGSLSSFDSA